MIQFRLDNRTGVSPSRQLVDQVRQSLQLGILKPGDKLPTVREVVSQIAINPNTVHRAYRDLEAQGLTRGQPGVGTFVVATLPAASPQKTATLQRQLAQWMQRAHEAGVDSEGVQALFAEALRQANKEGAA